MTCMRQCTNLKVTTVRIVTMIVNLMLLLRNWTVIVYDLLPMTILLTFKNFNQYLPLFETFF